jgi:hypothetical protein
MRASRLKGGTRLIINLEIQGIIGNQAKNPIIGIHTHPAKHTAIRYRHNPHELAANKCSELFVDCHFSISCTPSGGLLWQTLTTRYLPR